MTSTWVSVNGIVTSGEESRISALDHGFLYGDSVYETLRTYGGRPFLVGPHVDRLADSGAGLLLTRDFELQDVEQQITQVLQVARFSESLVRVIWSRGVGDLTYDLDAAQRSTLVVIAKPFTPFSAEYFEQGMSLAIVDVRRNPISSLDPRLKTSNLLNPRLAYLQARQQGATEALMLSPDGWLAEGSRNNVFLVEDGVVRTPAVGTGLLNGITRRLVLQLCAQEGLSWEECSLRPDRLATCQEVFVTSTTLEVMPVTQVDGNPVGSGRPGPVTRQLAAAYQRFVESGKWMLASTVTAHR